MATGEMVASRASHRRRAARRRSRRDRVRPQHDDADARVHPRRGPHARRRATRSSATRLDHDANVTPWRLAADDAGRHDGPRPVRPRDRPPRRGRGRRAHRADRTRWVTVTGASNALGTIPDVAAIVEARARGRRPGLRRRRAPRPPPGRSTPPRSAATRSRPRRTSGTARTPACSGSRRSSATELTPYKVRPAPDTAPERFETGTPGVRGDRGDRRPRPSSCSTEGMDALAEGRGGGVRAAARGPARPPRTSRSTGRATSRTAPRPSASRSTAAPPTQVADALAAEQVAVWGGHYYAVEVMAALGLADGGRRDPGRGVAATRPPEDVERLLAAVDRASLTTAFVGSPDRAGTVRHDRARGASR